MIHFNFDVKTNGTIYNINGEKFTSADDFFNTNQSREMVRNDWKESNADDYSFTKVNSYDEAKDLLFNGYKEALDEYVKVLNIQGNQKKKVTFKNDIIGFQPNVPNYLMGVPKCMINMHTSYVKTPVIDIHYDPRFSYDVDKEEFIRAGKKLLSALMTLEKMNYKINLYYTNFKCRDDSNNVNVCSIKLKDSNRPLNINRITFPMAHPAILRVFSFEWMSKVPNGTYYNGYGNGFFNAIPEKNRRPILDACFGTNARYLIGENIVNMSIEEIMEVIKNGN